MKTIVITGATSGIGLETARILCRQGFRVLGVGHSEKNCELAKGDLLSGNPEAQLTYLSADLMQQHEVLRVANELTAYINENCGGELYALINNAGCARNWYMTTDEGYEQQFALNYLAGFLLSHELLPLLLKSRGRVLMTGSESHKGIKVHWNDVMFRRGYNPLTAYKQSKLCDILFAKGLNDRYSADGLRAYVLDPGLVHTEIGSKAAGGIGGVVWALRKRHGVEPSVPAETYAFLCNPEREPQGLYYHLCEENTYSKEVTRENADRLFALSERLCGIRYESSSKGAIA